MLTQLAQIKNMKSEYNDAVASYLCKKIMM